MHTGHDKIKNARRIAVMGGTFDPIHYGHLAAAEAVRHALTLDVVLFIPAGQPPHKDASHITHGEHRYQMTLLATADHPCFDTSRIELDHTGPSYTVDTLRALAQMTTGEIILIVGADMLVQIMTWKDAAALFPLCRIVAVTRPGTENEELRRHMNLLRNDYGGKLQCIDMPAVAISGTEIRERVSAGQSIRYLLPPVVADYIHRHRLYASDNTYRAHDFEAIKRQLAARLSGERYAHTMGVTEEAVRLAAHYGVAVGKARLAGLLHDCAKEYSPEKKRALCRVYGIALDEVMDRQIDLTHSALSAETARHEYGVEDADILQAIRYHTTGHKHMTMLDKVVMLADYIEPTREDYPGLKKMRSLAYSDIDGALRVGIKHVIAYNEEKGRLIHPDSRDALRSLK